MNKNDIITKALNKKGQFASIEYKNELQAVTKDEIQDYLYASEKSNGELPTVLNIKLENITALK